MTKTIAAGGGGYKLELAGAARLRRTLKEAGDDLVDLTEAHQRAAKVVESGAVGLVPVRSGDLARTIRSTGTKTGGFVRAGTKAVPYAGVIHWGWPKRNIKANPFAAEAAQLTAPTWNQIYVEAVDKAIARIKGA